MPFDEQEKAMRRKGSSRKLRKRLVTLMVVVGLLCIVLGGILAMLSFTRTDPSRVVVIQVGGYVALFGLVLLLITWLIVSIPNMRRNTSPDVSRRRAVDESRKRRRHRKDPGIGDTSRDGAALIYALGLLAILSALVYHAMATLSARQQREDQLVHHGMIRAAIIEAGRDAMKRLAFDPDPATAGTNRAWMIQQDWTDPHGVGVRVIIDDESRRFDLNNLAVTVTGTVRTPEQVLLDLFVQCGEFSAGDLSRSLKDWVDADEDGSREARFYQAQDRDHLPSNRPLHDWNELMQVDGWSRELFTRQPARSLRRDLFSATPSEVFTLLPRPRDRIYPVNINTADRSVLLGLFGMDQEASVDRVLTFREMRTLHSLALLDGLIPEETLRDVGPYLDVRSSWFSIHMAAYRDGISARSRWLVHRDDQGEVALVQSVF